MQQSVAHSFLDSVDRQRSSSAVITPEKVWSYEEIGRLTGAVTSFVGSTSLGRGDRVALLLPNSAEYIAVFYGCHLAGCAVVALNIQEPAAVLARLLQHSDAKLLFIDAQFREIEKFRELSGSDGPQLVTVSEDSESWSRIVDLALPDYRRHIVDACSGDLAMLLYTSGTTGHPKGVMLSHRNLFANTESILEYINISWVDRGFNVLPFYYSFGSSIMHTHMTAGACLILQNHIAFPHAVLKRMGEEKATGFYGVPTTYTLLFGSDRLEGTDLSSLRYIAQAGGPMSVAKQQQLAKDLPGVAIFVMYGQTEATARLTYLSPDHLIDKAGSVGKAIPGVELRVGRSNSEVHTADSSAEVYASGDNIMMGYWNDSQATNEAIRDGWLRTGDLGYFDHDGFLFLTGRSSDMIKTGANRVSPSEIEDVVGQFPEVVEVGAYAVDDDILGQAIAVAIVLGKNSDLSIKEIQRRCLEQLSHYKVPKFVRFTTSLPKTSSGKLKRHVLAEEHEEISSSE
jgi:long-chain acyl-CoA synthetase